MEDKKEYQKNLQHLQAKLEKAQEQSKSLDPAGIKKTWKDYEQMFVVLYHHEDEEQD